MEESKFWKVMAVIAMVMLSVVVTQPIWAPTSVSASGGGGSDSHIMIADQGKGSDIGVWLFDSSKGIIAFYALKENSKGAIYLMAARSTSADFALTETRQEIKFDKKGYSAKAIGKAVESAE